MAKGLTIEEARASVRLSPSARAARGARCAAAARAAGALEGPSHESRLGTFCLCA